MKTILIILSLLVALSAQASGQFEHGSKFTATTYQGQVYMHCPSQMQTYFCHEVQLSPSEFSHFITDNTDANEVVITSYQADGKTREKSSKMNNGKSKKNFNLWISTLLQRPLLSFGVNNIQYTLKNNDSVIEEGDFSVEVQKGVPQICVPLHIWGSTSDCNSSSMACAQYFNRTTCTNK